MGKILTIRGRAYGLIIRGEIVMITAELTPQIDTLSNDKYQMVETYVDNVMGYSRHRKKDATWQKIKLDLMESEKRMRAEDGVSSGQLRKNLGM